MTAAQMGRRMGVSQPRITALEKAEISKAVTLQSLEHAAEALGCRLVYVLVPNRPLSDVLRERATNLAEKQLASVDQTMRLEAQAVTEENADTREILIKQLLGRPSRLWDELERPPVRSHRRRDSTLG